MSFLKTGLVQKIRTFAFLPNRTFPKNPDFHQKPLHMRVRILSEPLYIILARIEAIKRKEGNEREVLKRKHAEEVQFLKVFENHGVGVMRGVQQ